MFAGDDEVGVLESKSGLRLGCVREAMMMLLDARQGIAVTRAYLSQEFFGLLTEVFQVVEGTIRGVVDAGRRVSAGGRRGSCRHTTSLC
jgi:hypothetical protein